MLASAPTVVKLVFSEGLSQALSHAAVASPDGHRVTSETALPDELDVLMTGGDRGIYTVSWTAVSAVDGHVLDGAYAFGVGVQPGAQGALERAGPSPSDIAVLGLRWLEYLGLLGFIGTVVVRRLAANPPRLRWARPPMHLALTAAFLGGLGVVASEAWGASGSLAGAATYLAGGPPGWERVIRVAAEGVALLFCIRNIRFVVPLGVIAAVALAFVGHSGGVRPLAGAIFADALHVLSAGMWAGGIVVLATLRPPGGWRGREGRSFLDRFGGVALVAFAVTALTGALRATEELTAVSDLWTTSYGAVLSAKSLGVLAMLAMSAVVWRRGVPFARSEATVAVAVIALTALLAAYPLTPARVSDANALRDHSIQQAPGT
jgi:copper transport protein